MYFCHYCQYNELQDYKQDYVYDYHAKYCIKELLIFVLLCILSRFIIIAQFKGDEDTGVANSKYTLNRKLNGSGHYLWYSS